MLDLEHSNIVENDPVEKKILDDVAIEDHLRSTSSKEYIY